MNKVQELMDRFPDEDFLLADGLDSAIIGVEVNTMRVIYNHDKILSIFMKEGMTEEDALEHISYNILGAYVGEQTPIFIIKL